MAALAPSPTDYNRADQQRMYGAPRYFAWQFHLAAPYLGSRVIEIGCGIGNFTCWLAGREVTAVDPDPECLRVLERRWAARGGLRTLAGAAGAGPLTGVAPGAADSCVALNVLEHIADDHAALAEMAALVRPGGRVILLLPAFPALFGPVDRRLGHYRRYRRRGLRALAAAVGLAVERLEYVNCLGFFAWWLNARLRRTSQSPRQIAVFDRLAPSLERLERRIHLAFGQSLFSVLRCPGSET